jgi:hypothetical protein
MGLLIVMVQLLPYQPGPYGFSHKPQGYPLKTRTVLGALTASLKAERQSASEIDASAYGSLLFHQRIGPLVLGAASLEVVRASLSLARHPLGGTCAAGPIAKLYRLRFLKEATIIDWGMRTDTVRMVLSPVAATNKYLSHTSHPLPPY